MELLLNIASIINTNTSTGLESSATNTPNVLSPQAKLSDNPQQGAQGIISEKSGTGPLIVNNKNRLICNFGKLFSQKINELVKIQDSSDNNKNSGLSNIRKDLLNIIKSAQNPTLAIDTELPCVISVQNPVLTTNTELPCVIVESLDSSTVPMPQQVILDADVLNLLNRLGIITVDNQQAQIVLTDNPENPQLIDLVNLIDSKIQNEIQKVAVDQNPCSSLPTQPIQQSTENITLPKNIPVPENTPSPENTPKLFIENPDNSDNPDLQENQKILPPIVPAENAKNTELIGPAKIVTGQPTLITTPKSNQITETLNENSHPQNKSAANEQTFESPKQAPSLFETASPKEIFADVNVQHRQQSTAALNQSAANGYRTDSINVFISDSLEQTIEQGNAFNPVKVLNANNTDVKDSNYNFESVLITSQTQNNVSENTPNTPVSFNMANNPKPLTDVDQQVYEAIHNSVKQGDKQIVVRLNPPELGKVSIKFVEHSNQLSGLVEVDRLQTRIELQQAIPQILKSLADAGIQVRKLDIVLNSFEDFSDGSARENNAHDLRSGYQQNYFGHGFDERNSSQWFSSDVTAEVDEPQSILASDKSVNILV